MGYEVVYEYHDRTDEGYNKEELKDFKKKIGDAWEDVPLEKVAVAIMSQLARRDIWVVNVKVVQLIKKPISFKETKGGIVINNKKFIFDSSNMVSVVSEEAPEPTFDLEQPHMSTIQSKPNLPANKINLAPPIKKKPVLMTFSPEERDYVDLSRKYKLTLDKNYEITKREDGVMGQIYHLKDDSGKDIKLSEVYFIPSVSLLAYDDAPAVSSNTAIRKSSGRGRVSKDGLDWSGAEEMSDNIVLRR